MFRAESGPDCRRWRLLPPAAFCNRRCRSGLAETLWSAFGQMIWRDAVIIAILVFLLVLSRRERVIP